MEEERKSPVPENGEQQLPAENNSIENVEEENQEKELPAPVVRLSGSQRRRAAAILERRRRQREEAEQQRRLEMALDREQARILHGKRVRRRFVRAALITILAGIFAVLFLMPIVVTFTNSFMAPSEINANYGKVFATGTNGGKVFIADKVNLKFIPDMVTFSQYASVLFRSPEYLLKFWNSVPYVVPIVVFQLLVASLAAFGFARYSGKVRSAVFFIYIAVMLMPYQVTLVPNYLVSGWLHILNTRWAILLPGIFSPFAVYMLTKYMRRIPVSLYEAAEIDGAGEWQVFTQICMPLCRSGLVSIAILLFIDYWNMVEQPLVLLNNSEMHPLSVFLSEINAGEISLAFAVAVIYMVLPMLIFLYGEEYLVEGITYQGGVKE